MTLLERIREATLLEFNDQGPRFTMDDLARRLGISKKTLYEQVRDKESLLVMLVEEAWRSIKAQESLIVADASLDAPAKFRAVVAIMPVLGSALDYRRLSELQELYPAIRDRIDGHLEADWEVTLGLFEDCVALGKFRPVDRGVLREVLYATMERMLVDDFLERSGKAYEEALGEVLDLLVEGLRASPGAARRP
ncbi:MAG: TetR/AcrR family transcriptional regulator [Spirochaetaceae bacterium]|nr:TetR/AcrR family transcriptional regulator [Spirochaetaceae bacterium]